MNSTFTWGELVTDELLQSLREVAGVPASTDVAGLSNALAAVLANLGHLPVVDGAPDNARRTEIARRLLEEALQRVAAQMGTPRFADGVLSRTSNADDAQQELTARTTVHVNVADAATLEALPVLGPALARRVIDERLVRGAFRSIDEFVGRVHGVGPSAKEELAGLLSFLDPVRAVYAATREELALEPLLRRVLGTLPQPTPEARLLAALHLAGVACATSRGATGPAPHPIEDSSPEPTYHDAALVAPLLSRRYYYALLELLGEATHAISIAMFHAALPGDDHPTRSILDALIAAKDRGVLVRVLLDRDREEDPYHSTVINEAAKAYLEAGGVTCRFDAEDVLLHSKVVILDGATVVIGSHNWSAGSYFQFDDASVAIESTPYAAVMTARFDAAWSAAQEN